MSRVILAAATLFAFAAMVSWIAFSWTNDGGWNGTAITFTFAAAIAGFIGAMVGSMDEAPRCLTRVVRVVL